MSEATHVTSAPTGRRFTLRRAAALTLALALVSCSVYLLGAAYLWPLFIFPLFLAAVFFFELGSLAVTFWLGNFFVLYYSLFGRLRRPTSSGRPCSAPRSSSSPGCCSGACSAASRHARRLAASSLTDRLTGLYNYGTFVDYLHTEVTEVDRYGGDLSLIMLDLDHFKRFNDTHGHEAGNELLRRVGTPSHSLVREADMAARYGGEEFAVLIRGDEVHGYELAERLRRAVEAIDSRCEAARRCPRRISAGVASYPGAARTRPQLVERADAALYESKRRGRNRVTIYAGSRADAEAHAASARDVRVSVRTRPPAAACRARAYSSPQNSSTPLRCSWCCCSRVADAGGDELGARRGRLKRTSSCTTSSGVRSSPRWPRAPDRGRGSPAEPRR